MGLPVDAQARKNVPLARGLLDYFPDALCAVAELSRIGNEQHNPGEPLHWAKEKSTDEADALLRHLIDRGKRDVDGIRHSAKVAWRALALLQREIDAELPPANESALNPETGRTYHDDCRPPDRRTDPGASDPCGRPDCEYARLKIDHGHTTLERLTSVDWWERQKAEHFRTSGTTTADSGSSELDRIRGRA